MPDEALLTLKQLAAELGLPESTVRYYRDAFLDHIPSVGTGRRRRYPPQAVAVLRSIAGSYAGGRSRIEIIQAIEHQGPRKATLALQASQAQSHRSLEEVSNLDLLAAILDGEREQRDALWQMAKEIVRLAEVLEGQDKVLTEIADKAGVEVPGRAFAPSPRPAPALHAPAPEPLPALVPEPLPAMVPEPPPGLVQATVSAPAARPAAPASVEFPAAVAQAAPVAPPLPLAADEPPRTTAAFSVGTMEPSTAPAVPPPEPAGPHVSAWSMPPVPPEEPAPAAGPAVAGAGSGTPSDVERLRTELEAERALVERLQEARMKLEHRAADAEAELEERRQRRSSVIKRILGGEPK